MGEDLIYRIYEITNGRLYTDRIQDVATIIDKKIIEIKTLDKITKMPGILPPDFIKIDIQGYEYEALKGAKKTLEINSPIICLEEVYSENSRAIKFLESLNYEIVDVALKEHIFKKK